MNQFECKKFIEFQWDNVFNPIEVSIETPDLTKSEAKVRGDWAKNYIYKIDPSDPFKITYKTAGQTFRSLLEVGTIELQAPLKEEQRKITPFFIKLNDIQKKVGFSIWFNPSGEVAKVEIDERSPNPSIAVA